MFDKPKREIKNFIKKEKESILKPLAVTDGILKTTTRVKKRKDQSLGSYIGDVVVKGINRSGKEVHYPGGYRFLGPGTHLKKRLARGEKGINSLDEAARQHDLAYEKYLGTNGSIHDPQKIREADIELNNKATSIYKDSSKGINERLAAYIASKMMGVKT